jgi:hypothetical protein
MEVLNKHRESSLDTLLKSLQSTMHEWAGSTEFADDVTLLALELGSLLVEKAKENEERTGRHL